MHPIRKMLKYILWGILFFIVGLITIGLFVYRLDVVGYVQYLNTRDLMDVSLSQPMSFVRLFVPSQKEEIVSIEDMLGTWEDDTDTSGAFLDQDFMDFFGDFSKQDRASKVMTGADFGFIAEPIDAAIVSGQDTVLTEAEQQALLIERLRQREARLEQEAMMGSQQ